MKITVGCNITTSCMYPFAVESPSASLAGNLRISGSKMLCGEERNSECMTIFQLLYHFLYCCLQRPQIIAANVKNLFSIDIEVLV
jgi:hypothetical protein